MTVAFAAMICLAVAAPFIAFAWAMKQRQCPHCGGSINPDPVLVKQFFGE